MVKGGKKAVKRIDTPGGLGALGTPKETCCDIWDLAACCDQIREVGGACGVPGAGHAVEGCELTNQELDLGNRRREGNAARLHRSQELG